MTPHQELSNLENQLDVAMTSLERNREKVQQNIKSIQELEQRIDEVRHGLMLASEYDEEL